MSSETRMRHKSDNAPNQPEQEPMDIESVHMHQQLDGDRGNICLLLLLYVLQGEYTGAVK